MKDRRANQSANAPLAAGRLRDRIVIRRLADVSDNKGGFTRSWTTIAECMAEVINLSGREAVIGSTLQGLSTYRITIRMSPAWLDGGDAAPRASDQVQWRGPELNIIAPPADPNGRREALVIMADTSVPQGA